MTFDVPGEEIYTDDYFVHRGETIELEHGRCLYRGWNSTCAFMQVDRISGAEKCSSSWTCRDLSCPEEVWQIEPAFSIG
jgi:hypothetical protein